MECLVRCLVVRLLEEDIGTDTGLVQLAIVLDCRGGDIDVHATDRTVLMVYRVDGGDGLEDVLDGVVHGIFSGFECEAFVPHVLERRHFATDLILGEFAARDGFILEVVGTVHAPVYAVVGEIQRCEHDDTIAVETLFDLFGE